MMFSDVTELPLGNAIVSFMWHFGKQSFAERLCCFLASDNLLALRLSRTHNIDYHRLPTSGKHEETFRDRYSPHPPYPINMARPEGEGNYRV